MKLLKLVGVAVLIGIISGCQTSPSIDDNTQYITVGATITEAKTIINNRARSTEALCIDKQTILDCELLGINATDPRQYMKFVFVDKPQGSKIFITHWFEFKDKKGKVDRTDVDMSKSVLKWFADYIEKHRNKLNK